MPFCPRCEEEIDSLNWEADVRGRIWGYTGLPANRHSLDVNDEDTEWEDIEFSCPHCEHALNQQEINEINRQYEEERTQHRPSQVFDSGLQQNRQRQEIHFRPHYNEGAMPNEWHGNRQEEQPDGEGQAVFIPNNHRRWTPELQGDEDEIRECPKCHHVFREESNIITCPNCAHDWSEQPQGLEAIGIATTLSENMNLRPDVVQRLINQLTG